MTKLTQKKDGSHLSDAILASLKREPSRSIKDLATELGFASITVGVRVKALYDEGEIDFVKVRPKGSFASTRLWHVCDTPRLPGARTPTHVIIQRDWLQVAFWGSACKEAA